MKNASLALILLTTCFFACQSANETDDTTESSNDSSTIVTDSGNSLNTMNSMDTIYTGPVSDMDKEFMKEAAAGGTTEVLAGRIAAERANNPRVKAFANMMIADHEKANTELKTIASRKTVDLPDSVMAEQHKMLNDLRTMPARSFDATYMKMMDKDHRETISKFEKAAQNCDDSNVKAFASKTLPALRMHKDSVDAIQRSL